MQQAAPLHGVGKLAVCAAEIALSHREWWDGTGYPARSRGDKIPLRGRITAVADVVDALTHARPYKDAWSVGQAMDEIQGLSCRQFDPAVVEAFNRTLQLPVGCGPTES